MPSGGTLWPPVRIHWLRLQRITPPWIDAPGNQGRARGRWIAPAVGGCHQAARSGHRCAYPGHGSKESHRPGRNEPGPGPWQVDSPGGRWMPSGRTLRPPVRIPWPRIQRITPPWIDEPGHASAPIYTRARSARRGARCNLIFYPLFPQVAFNAFTSNNLQR